MLSRLWELPLVMYTDDATTGLNRMFVTGFQCQSDLSGDEVSALEAQLQAHPVPRYGQHPWNSGLAPIDGSEVIQEGRADAVCGIHGSIAICLGGVADGIPGALCAPSCIYSKHALSPNLHH